MGFSLSAFFLSQSLEFGDKHNTNAYKLWNLDIAGFNQLLVYVMHSVPKYKGFWLTPDF